MKKIEFHFLHAHKKTTVFAVITGILLIGFLFDLSTIISINETLHPLYQAIEQFISQTKRTPESLREIEMFAAKEKLWIDGSKGHMHGVSYQRLNHKYFFIQEFLEKEGRSSEVRRSSLTNVTLGIQEFALSKTSAIHFYPFEMLDGIKIGDLNIGLIVDFDRGEKHLLIALKNSSEREITTLVAPHDFVDEYFVLPGNRQVLFSASEKNQFSSGLYLWDLISNRAQQINNINALSVLKAADATQTALVGMSADVVYFFMKKNALPIFSCSNLFSFNIHSHLVSEVNDQCQLQQFFSSIPFFTTSEIRKYLQSQNLEKTIEWWQETLAHSEHHLPSTPHALWILANLYVQLSEGHKTLPEQRKVLKVYAKELLAQLNQLALAPRYLRDISAQALSSPNLSEVLRFRFTMPQGLAE